MKKLLSFTLATVCVFALVGCKTEYEGDFWGATPDSAIGATVTKTPIQTDEVLDESPNVSLTPETTAMPDTTATPVPTPDTSKGTVMYTSPDLTTVYKEADGNSEKLATLERDSEVITYNVVNKMYYVQYETGKFGYIYSFELFSEKNGTLMYVTTDGVNVRKGPSTSEEKLATLKKGVGYLTFGKTDGWVYIQYDSGKKGYVSEQYLSKTPIPDATKYTEMYVVAKNTNVRKGPASSSAVVATISNIGTKVYAYENTNGWVYVQYATGKYGYISANLLSKNAPTVSPAVTPTVTPTPTAKPTLLPEVTEPPVPTPAPTAKPTIQPEVTESPMPTPTPTPGGNIGLPFDSFK